MRLAPVASSLSAEPILSAFAGFRGSIIDLDQGQVYGPASLEREHTTLRAALRARGVLAGQRVLMAVGNGRLATARTP
jgi:hypothetical protein